MQTPRALIDMSGEELREFVTGELGQSAFRAEQIAEWLGRGAEIGEMTNLPRDLREKLSQNCIVGGDKDRQNADVAARRYEEISL